MSRRHNWEYGRAGDLYPVEPNQVWSVGPHRFACVDLEQQALVPLLYVMVDGREV